MIELGELKGEVTDTYNKTLQLIEMRLHQAWRYDEVVSLFKETLRLASNGIIKRILKEHSSVDKDREKLQRMKKRLDDTYDDLKEGVEEWSEKTFYAVCDGISEQLSTRKIFPLVMDDVAFEEAIWKIMECIKTPAQIRFENTFVHDERHKKAHEAFLHGEMALQRGKVKESIDIWKESINFNTEFVSPGTLRELGVMHRLQEVGLNNQQQALKMYQEAALRGSAVALFSIGIFYKNGTKQIDRDDSMARFYYELAAQRGSSQACFALASWYAKGTNGVPKDLQKAYVYYAIAEGLSVSEASKKKQEIKKLVKQRQSS